MEDIIFENDSFVIELEKEEEGGEITSYSMDGDNYDLVDSNSSDDFNITITIN